MGLLCSLIFYILYIDLNYTMTKKRKNDPYAALRIREFNIFLKEEYILRCKTIVNLGGSRPSS